VQGKSVQFNKMGLLRLLHLLFLCSEASRISNAFTPTPSFHNTKSPSVLSAVSSETSQSSLPTVEFVDPQTGCEVVLLGCFHGTESSSQDVKRVVTPGTNVVALELCSLRFADLRREQQEPETNRPWIIAYLDMISKTVQKRGLPTGLAAAVLAGFSGFQSAISGFVPGLEFKTAIEQSIMYECDIVLVDQVVDETLRQIGSLPRISWHMNVPSNITNTLAEWKLHSTSLRRAIIGDENLPRVQLGEFLFRNSASIQDLIRLTIPPISMSLLLAQMTSSIAMANELVVVQDYSAPELIFHWFASAGVIFSSFVGLTLPAVKVIITERDVVLTNGIQAACKQAGDGGRVVAVLGFLHVNGVAKRMIENEI
jgi:pheromone shutdown protein TraB